MKKEIGKVLKLFISSNNSKLRVEKETLVCDKSGIKNDKFYDKDINRSVLLSSTFSYKLAKENNIVMDYGTLGENILLDFDPHSLNIGTQLQIGEVILEISQNCTICNHLSSINKALPKLLETHRGIFALVKKDGIIKDNDIVTIII